MKIIFKKLPLILIFIGSAFLLVVLFIIYPKFYFHQLTDQKLNKVYFPKQGINIAVETAVTPYEQEKGLMFKKSLPQDSGMLFLFPTESTQSFWMKNTLIPLDIIFISKDKKIVDVKENFAPCPDSQIICPIYISRAKSMYVVEVNAGFVKNNKIEIGDKVEF